MTGYSVFFGFALLAGIVIAATAQAEENASVVDKAALIEEALSAAPEAIAAIATVKNWDGETLKAGSDSWVCYPSMPDREGVCPMCLDKPWQAWLAAFAAGEEPEIESVGISYMLRGDCAVSNLDPMAMEKTDHNEWVHEGPHLMILAPDASDYEGVSHDPHGGEPYVMWRGTPYVHIMAPLPAN